VTEVFDDPKLRDDLLVELRERAAAGANVRQLTHCIQSRLGTPPLAVIPVLAYFCRAFEIRLPKALPIREWLGTDHDAEIDALILPEIEATRHQWEAEALTNGESSGSAPSVAMGKVGPK
jgi:hypothetical protein